MDNNILEMIIKMMSGSFNNSNQTQTQQNNEFYTSYPQDGFSKAQNNSHSQNILPLLMSLLNKNLTATVQTSDNKKAEVTSAPSDEILL